MEAEARSGTSITARFAREQQKEVFCIPSSIDNRKGIGTNTLIKKGATLVLKPSEIIMRYMEYDMKQICIEDLKEETKDFISTNFNVKEEYKEIYNVLLNGELSLNDICIRTNLRNIGYLSKDFYDGNGWYC